jgi:hypothetical protein
MSAKKSNARTNTSRAANGEAAQRPFSLIVLILAAGAASTWYWYRPLPKSSPDVEQVSANAPRNETRFSKEPRPKSRWKDSGLVFPTSDPADLNGNANTIGTSNSANMSGSTASPNDPQPLTGSGDLALKPFLDRERPLTETVAREPLPMMPIPSPNASLRAALPPPKLWTNAPSIAAPLEPTQSLPTNSLASDAASPFRVPSVHPSANPRKDPPSLITNIWPDQGFDPSRPNPIASRPPSAPSESMNSVMALSSNRIRTLEPELDSKMPRVLPPRLPDSGLQSDSHNPMPPVQSQPVQPPPRQPGKPIRQPSKR